MAEFYCNVSCEECGFQMRLAGEYSTEDTRLQAKFWHQKESPECGNEDIEITKGKT